ncbi:MAG TPA: 5'-3' exonuclease H3TH domain-containing protein, partial [Stellaceae bacterium]|nr:5'-3' exonuclease H3TH domain-containing protein [Stellaceae bacterium]
MTALRHVYLVDGSGFIFRAYHALPPLTSSDGTPVGAVLGFSNMLLKLLQNTDADHIAVVFDSAKTSFRNRLYEAYKAHRPDPPDDLVPQFKLVREATDAFNVCRIEREDFEADDLIATYARHGAAAGAIVTIVSSDKDLMQLVSDRIQMLDPIKDRPIGAAEVREKFGVGPDKVIDVQALCGDSVDNVPGVPGIGVKTAAELINTYGTLENLLEHAPEIKQPKRRQSLIEFAEQARLSKRLVTLDQDVPLPAPLEDLAVKPLDREKLTSFLKAHEFRTLLARVAKLGEEPPKPAPRAPAMNGAVMPSVPTAAPDLTPVARQYELVQDLAALERWIAEAYAQGSVAVDTETSSVDSALAELVGISLALAPGRACYIPLGHTAAKADGLELAPPPPQIPRADALARLKPL